MTNELIELVKHKVQNLRPKLLDLSRRNPLLATKFSPRSNAHIRVVDELPEVLFYKINNGQEMRFIPLPEIADDTEDEDTKAFRDALANAKLTDESYLSDLNAIERDADDDLDRTRKIERALKDRIRAELSMSPRPRQGDVNLAQHARNNGIVPSYELPLPERDAVDTRHTDDDIQTLLLPKDLERKLNKVTSKCRTWIQETGINVLHVAYGFLEWSEPNQTETSYAPLVLCGAQIEKKRSREGIEFRISGIGEDPEINAVLAEKMRLEFGIELPPFEGSSLEDYFAAIATVKPRQLVWRVRRQVAIGVFPSARMAMYHDINPANPDFPDSEIVRSLLGGSNSETSMPFAEEYNVDKPVIEHYLPCVVVDADSSQLSALVDIAKGKNLAIEGPPGTGKSQTIVNAIAAALNEGKKILFVAEKLAALNVVRSRLESIGLGEFIMPLQAESSTREQVIASVRERVEMRPPTPVPDYDDQLADYRRVRIQLAEYIDLLKISFGTSGFTIHEILCKSIATAQHLENIPPDVLQDSLVPETYLNRAGITRLKALAQAVERASQDASAAKLYWQATGLVHAERFTVEEICNLAAQTAHAYRTHRELRDTLHEYRITLTTSDEDLTQIQTALENLLTLPGVPDERLLIEALRQDSANALAAFIASCEAYAGTHTQLASKFSGKLDEATRKSVEEIAALCRNMPLDSLDCEALQEELRKRHQALDTMRNLASMMVPLTKVRPESAQWPLVAIGKAHVAIRQAGRQALLCRNASTNDPAALDVLNKLIVEGQALQEIKVQLEKHISLSVDVSVETLALAITTLRSAGFFSIFSRAFQQATRLARSLSLADRYEKRDALMCLEALAAFRAKERAFMQNPQTARLFGLHFRGVETDFAPFEKLAAYYEFAHSALSGPETRGLRNFLREADLDELELVPPIPADTRVNTFANLTQNVFEAEHGVTTMATTLDRLSPLLSVFRDPRSVSPHCLVDLAAQLTALFAHHSALDCEQNIARLLGPRFAGPRTDIGPLKPICVWAHAAAPVARHVESVIAGGRPAEAAAHIRRTLQAKAHSGSLLASLCERARIKADEFVGSHDEMEFAAFLEAAANDRDGLFAHATLATALASFDGTGTDALVAYWMDSGASESLPVQLEALAVRKLARAVYAQYGQKLSGYSGNRLDELRAELAHCDKNMIELSQKQLRWKVHAGAKPQPGNGIGRKSTWTQMALIDNEINKQQRFISVRDLTQRAGRALLELKPCWMMSPLAVAQYIPKNALTFDLCIIDEASQMPPEAAIGALLRCKQTVVVGDTNQLPPSNFFKKMTDDEEADEDDTVLNESILEMANATFRPARRLRWHYRSRHSGLIKFSNRLVYQDNLIVFPSATESMARMGIEFRKVEGLYKAGTNKDEAAAIVDAVLEFMHNDPDRSLGVVTLNQKQRDLIAEEFEYVLSRDRHAQSYVETWKEKRDGLEEFFIKNLENVQGDERDVMFIGIVYGPESKGGRVAQRFGPINGLAGKRRLNVLFSRAKEKIVTFSSMTAADVLADENGNAGAYMLKRWLEYCATGMLDGSTDTPREPQSDFEVFVIDQIRAMGCAAVPQVGVAGYFVDIGVRHPDWPHGFILGVECDGASYHSAKSARDRDRLRQEQLERLGWRFHRIWSTDWFNYPRREAERLRDVIAARLAELKVRESEFAAPRVHSEALVTVKLPESQPKVKFSSSAQIEQTTATMKPSRPADDRGVAVGDMVRVRYLNGDCNVLQITISAAKNDPSHGIVHYQMPIAKALLGAEEGDEVEVLNGPYVRPALVEAIVKSGSSGR